MKLKSFVIKQRFISFLKHFDNYLCTKDLLYIQRSKNEKKITSESYKVNKLNTK